MDDSPNPSNLERYEDGVEPGAGWGAQAVAGVIAGAFSGAGAEPDHWLRVIFDHAAPGMFMCDMQGRLLRVNAALCRMLSRPAADLIGFSSERFTHPDEAATRQHLLDKLLHAKGKTVKANRRYLKSDGSVVWLKLSLTVVREGDTPVGVVGTTTDITRSRRVATKLRESEARFEELADAMPQIVFTATPDGHVDYFNHRWYEYTGLAPGVTGDAAWEGALDDEHRAKVHARWSAALASGEPYELELPLRRADGAWRWHLGRAMPVRGASGEIVRWFGTDTDIHDRRLAEEALRESEGRARVLAGLSESTRDVADPDAIKSIMVEMLGERLGTRCCALAESDPRDPARLLIEADRAEGEASIRGVYRWDEFDPTVLARIRAGETVVVGDGPGDLPSAKGLVPRRWEADLLAICPLLKGGDLAAMLVVLREAGGPTRWKRHELLLVGSVLERGWSYVEHARVMRRLVESQHRLADTVTGSLDAIICMDRHGHVIEWNPAAEAMFGYTRDAALGRELCELIVPEEMRDRHRAGLARYLATGEAVVLGRRLELTAVREDGSRLPVELTVTRATQAGPPEFNGVVRDITERVEADREREALLGRERRAREESELAGRMKDEFLATLSHELRTPLHAILGWSRMLTRQSGLPEMVSEGLETIQRSAGSQAQIIEDLLDMSRIISGKVRLTVGPVDLVRTINDAVDTVRPAAAARGVDLAVDAAGFNETVQGDADRLKQVFWNLLSNAVKFTPRGGRVAVDVRRAGTGVTVRVKDSGRGIDPAFLPHVFDRFRQADSSSTRSHGGLGLGLSIVKQLVELHGGTVAVDSRGEGHGATFIVELPPGGDAAAEAAEEVATRHDERQRRDAGVGPDLAGLRVLVVDDEADARQLLRRLLEERGVEVADAASADDAIAAARADRFDLIVSDVGMPNEDGLSMMQRLRKLPSKHNGRTPAIALTAYARVEDRVKAMVAGFQMHVAKPVDADELLVLIAGLTGRSRGVDVSRSG